MLRKALESEAAEASASSTQPVQIKSKLNEGPESLSSNNVDEFHPKSSVDYTEREREALGSMSSSWMLMEKSRGRQMTLSNSFTARSPTVDAILEVKSDTIPKDGVIVIVDPFSTGLHLAAQVAKHGLRVARVFSMWNSPISTLVQEGIEVDFCATIQHNSSLDDTNKAVEETIINLKSLPFPIIAVIPG